MQKKYIIIVGILFLIGIATAMFIYKLEMFSTSEKPQDLQPQLKYYGEKENMSLSCTPSSMTTCNENICTLYYHGYTQYTTEDNNPCTRIDQAKSLLNSGITPFFIEQDKDFIAKIIDYNLTSMTLDLSTSSKEFNKDIPIKVYRIDQNKIASFCESAKTIQLRDLCENKTDILYSPKDLINNYGYLVNSIYDMKINETERFSVLSNSKLKEYPFGMDYFLEYGYNSTIVILNDSNGGNMKDADILSTALNTNYGAAIVLSSLNYTTKRESLIAFDLNKTFLPLGSNIISAYLFLNLTGNLLDNDETFDESNTLGIYQVYNNFTMPTFDLIPNSGNDNPTGITQNGTYFWIVDNTDDEVYQYYMNGTYTGTHFDTNSIGCTNPRSITNNGSLFWVTHYASSTEYTRVYPFYMNGTFAGDNWSTLGVNNNESFGIVTNNTYIWLTNNADDEVYQYYMNGTYTGTHFDTAGSGNGAPYGITQNGTYFWIVDNIDGEVYQYYMNGTYTDFTFDTAGSGNGDPPDITQNGTYFWIVDNTDDEVYQYYMNGTYSPMEMEYIEGSKNGATTTQLGAITYNRKPGSTYMSPTPESTNYFLDIFRSPLGWYNWSVLNFVNYSYNQGEKNITLYMRSTNATMNALSDGLSFSSKEATAITSRPYLQIVYDTGGADSIIPGINTTINQSYVYQNHYINFSSNISTTGQLSSCWFEINQTGQYLNYSFTSLEGVASASCSNVTKITAVSGYNVTWRYWVNDTSNSLNSSNISSFIVSNDPGGYWLLRAPTNSTNKESGYSLERRYGTLWGNGYDTGMMWRNNTLDNDGNDLGYERRQCAWWFQNYFDEPNYTSVQVKNVYCHMWTKDSSGMGMSSDYDFINFFPGTFQNSSSIEVGNAMQHNLSSYFLGNWNRDFYLSLNNFTDLSIKVNGTNVHMISFPNQRSFCIVNDINGTSLTDNTTLATTDVDQDSVSDFDEIWTTHTDPYTNDTDKDGHTDYQEYINGKNGWDPYDWGFIHKYNLGSNGNIGYINLTNSSDLIGRNMDIINLNSTLERQLTSDEMSSLAYFDYNNITSKYETNDSDYGNVQINFRYNITENKDIINDIIIFHGAGYDYGPDVSGLVKNYIRIKNVSEVSTPIDTFISGRKTIGEHVFYSQNLKNVNLSEFINPEGYLYYGLFSKYNATIPSNYSLKTFSSEVWVILGETELNITAPINQFAVTSGSNLQVNFSYKEDGTNISSGITVNSIMLNDTLNCPISGVVLFDVTNQIWSQNCTVPCTVTSEEDMNLTLIATSGASTLSDIESNAIHYDEQTICDTCSPGSSLTSNYLFECSDNCLISNPINAMKYNITINGTGSFTLLESIFNISRVTIKSMNTGICKVHCSGGKCFSK